MADLDWTESYLNTLEEEAGKMDSGWKRGFAVSSSIPVWLAEKGVEIVTSIPDTLKTLKEVMYKNPEGFDPEEYEGKIMELASTVLGGGLGTSSLVKGEVGGTVLAMNKAAGLKQWATESYKMAQSMPTEQKAKFLEIVQDAYSQMESRVGQDTFDLVNSISPEAPFMGGATKGTYSVRNKGINVDAEGSDAINTLFHELTHAHQYGREGKEISNLFSYTNQAREKALAYAETSEEIPFYELEQQIYKRHDPTEAMARYVGQEMKETSSSFEDTVNAYLDAFTKGHEEYSARPRSKKGFDLGPDFEQFFKNIYTDRTAERAIKEIQKKAGII